MLVKHTVAQINIKIKLQKRHPSNGDASSNQSVDSVKKIDYFDASALAGALTSPAWTLSSFFKPKAQMIVTTKTIAPKI